MSEPVTDGALLSLARPNQNFLEWKNYLSFVQGYFASLGVERPVVVELGTQDGAQKEHYERFLDAVHIGIDICPGKSGPDILGDSRAPDTVERLKERLAGRRINLLFIDASHHFKDALREFELYNAMVEHIIAFHDIKYVREIGCLWEYVQARNENNPHVAFVTFGAWGRPGRYPGFRSQLGIGLVIKQVNREYEGL